MPRNLETVEMPQAKPEDYNAVVDLVELIDIKLIDSRFEVKPVFFMSDRENLSFTYDCDLVKCSYDPDDGRLVGMVAAEAGSKKGRAWILRVRATYIVAYEISGSPTEEAVHAFLERVGRFACYPYFRAHFATMCAEARADAPPLPVLKGPNLPRKISRNDSNLVARQLDRAE